ncbi:MAG: hypothetical protein QOF60_1696 [Actinomycetota bacterium]|nr:hypothetical protein [Actinomycetota bacterium]
MILPVRNEAGGVGRQLDALVSQSFDRPWEIVVVDDGSTDATAAIVSSFVGRPTGPAVRLVSRRGGRPNIAGARNLGVAGASSSRLLFCDGDDVVQPGWVAALVGALSEGGSIVGGALVGEDGPRVGDAGMAFALGANMAVAAAVFEAVGGFDEAVPFACDTEFSYRAQLRGWPLVHAPSAVVLKGERSTLSRAMVQEWRWGWEGVAVYRKLRPEGMGAGSWRASLGEVVGLVRGAPVALRSRRGRGRWARRLAFRLGRLVGSARYLTFRP